MDSQGDISRCILLTPVQYHCLVSHLFSRTPRVTCQIVFCRARPIICNRLFLTDTDTDYLNIKQILIPIIFSTWISNQYWYRLCQKYRLIGKMTIIYNDYSLHWLNSHIYRYQYQYQVTLQSKEVALIWIFKILSFQKQQCAFVNSLHNVFSVWLQFKHPLLIHPF